MLKKSVALEKSAPKVGVKRVPQPISKSAKIPNSKVDKKSAKSKNGKVIRDSFTIPEVEHKLITTIKKRCAAKGLAVKKSEVLRAALGGFASQSDDYIKAALGSLEIIKTGRPSKKRK